MKSSLVRLGVFVLGFFFLGCSNRQPGVSPPSADELTRALANEYLEGYLDRYPEQATVYGVPGRRHEALFDNSLEALQDWKSRENAWLVRAARIDASTIKDASLRATYAILRDSLEGSIAMRS